MVDIMCQAIAEGLNERKAEKDKDSAATEKEEASGRGTQRQIHAPLTTRRKSP
ncbi:MAG: hypothetical protein MZV63_44280 [Marinilabiliales bacterium]|nr:hypothetical protein [Marinilabiliales bacterium]